MNFRMNSTVFCENQVLEKLTSLANEKKFDIGLVIGQKSSGHVYVIHIVPLLKFDSDTEERPSNLMLVSDVNVALHANQISRMLPGGLEVIGIYVIMDSSCINGSLSSQKIRFILRAINKSISKYYLDIYAPNSEAIVMFGCSKSLRTGIKYVNINESTTTFFSGDLKSRTTQWTELDYSYSLSQSFSFSKEGSYQTLFKSVLNQLHPWAMKIADAIVLINGKIGNEEDLLSSDDNKYSRKKIISNKTHLNITPPKVMRAEFLEKMVIPSSECSLKEISCSLVFTGTVAGRAFLNDKATIKEATRAVRNDLLRSLVARWEMHCDSLVEEPLPSNSEPVIHEPPRRVFLEGGSLPISLCDYLFPGDTANDACLSAKDLFDITVSPQNVDVALEVYADPSELLKNSSPISSPVDSVSKSSNNNMTLYFYLLSVIFAVLSIIVFYLFISTPQKNKF